LLDDVPGPEKMQASQRARAKADHSRFDLLTARNAFDCGRPKHRPDDRLTSSRPPGCQLHRKSQPLLTTGCPQSDPLRTIAGRYASERHAHPWFHTLFLLRASQVRPTPRSAASRRPLVIARPLHLLVIRLSLPGSTISSRARQAARRGPSQEPPLTAPLSQSCRPA